MINRRQEMLPCMASSLWPRTVDAHTALCTNNTFQFSTCKPIPSKTHISYDLPIISFLRRFFASSANTAAMSAAKTKAQGIIDENAVGTFFPYISYTLMSSNADQRVAVFSKSWCPYCKASKQLLSELGAKAYILELDEVGRSPFDIPRADYLREQWLM